MTFDIAADTIVNFERAIFSNIRPVRGIEISNNIIVFRTFRIVSRAIQREISFRIEIKKKKIREKAERKIIRILNGPIKRAARRSRRCCPLRRQPCDVCPAV